MDFYDAHVHFLWKGPFARVARGWEPLLKKGLKGMALIIMGHHPGDREKCFDMVPNSYHERIDPDFFSKKTGTLVSSARELTDLNVFPYLDSRFIENRDLEMKRFNDAGFRGLKILYVPEEDRENSIIGWKKLFGRIEAESREMTEQMVEQAAGLGWPVMFHVNLKLYKAFAEEILRSHPDTPFIFPHFGFSRKIMARFMENFKNCYTDFSSLLPFFPKDPQAYRGFIETFQDRVLFGSDGLIGWPELTGEYLATIKGMIRDEGILKKILCDNYLRIHRTPS